jgi:hypothetical protein
VPKILSQILSDDVDDRAGAFVISLEMLGVVDADTEQSQ